MTTTNSRILLTLLLALPAAACDGAMAVEDGDSIAGGKADDTAVCGNGEVEGDEECDDHGTDPGDGCDAACKIEVTAFRLDSLSLRDPHGYVKILFSCSDVTNQFDKAINDRLNKDK